MRVERIEDLGTSPHRAQLLRLVQEYVVKIQGWTIVDKLEAIGMHIAERGMLLALLNDADTCVGFLAGLQYPELLESGNCAIVIAWYVQPSSRGTLKSLEMLRTFESWAQGSGCRSVSIGFMHSLELGNQAHAYEDLGYGKYEVIFRKKLCQ